MAESSARKYRSSAGKGLIRKEILGLLSRSGGRMIAELSMRGAWFLQLRRRRGDISSCRLLLLICDRLQKRRAVALQLDLPDAGDFEELVLIARPPLTHLDERDVAEDHVGGHPLLGRNVLA